MNIMQIAALGLICVVLAMLVKEYHAPIGLLIILAFGIVVFSQIFSQLAVILDTFRAISAQAGVNNLYLSTIFKVIGIAYIGEFAAQTCRDGGSNAIASKIELAAKIIILSLMLPILSAILQNILALA